MATELTDETVNKLNRTMDKLLSALISGGNMSSGNTSRAEQDLKKSVDELSSNISMSNEHAASNDIQSLKNTAAAKSLTAGMRNGFKSQSTLFAAFSDDIRTHGNLAAKTFDDSLSNLEYKYFDQIPEIFKDVVSKSNLSDSIKETFSKITDSAEVMNIKNKTAAKQNNLYLMKEYQKLSRSMKTLGKTVMLSEQGEAEKTRQTAEYAARLAEISPILKAANFSTHEYTQDVDDMAKNLKETSSVIHEVGVQLEKKSKSISMSGVGSGLLKAGAAALAMANVLRMTTMHAAKFGTQVDTIDAFKIGMSTEELAQAQADQRQAINSSGMSFNDFNDSISTGTKEMWGHTGSLRDAARVNAESLNNSKLLGADREQFMSQQRAQFIKFNSVFSMTADTFMEMNKQLLDSQSVRGQLFKLDKSARASHLQDIQNTYQKLKVDGLLHEQAMKVIDAMEQIGSSSPKERMKDAAKLQATMGALGMGAEGARAGELMRGGLRGKGDKAEFAELMKQANINMGSQQSQGFGKEMMFSELMSKSGMDKYIGQDSAYSDLNIQKEQAMKQGAVNTASQTESLKNIHKNMGELISITDQLNASVASPIVGVLLGISGILSGGILSTLKNIVTGIGSLLVATISKGSGLMKGAGAKLLDLKGKFTKTIGPMIKQTIGTMGKSVVGLVKGNLVGTLTKVMGPVAALTAAASAGWMGGELLNKYILPDSWKDSIGKSVAWAIQPFSDTAKQALELDKQSKSNENKISDLITAFNTKDQKKIGSIASRAATTQTGLSAIATQIEQMEKNDFSKENNETMKNLLTEQNKLLKESITQNKEKGDNQSNWQTATLEQQKINAKLLAKSNEQLEEQTNQQQKQHDDTKKEIKKNERLSWVKI